MISKKLDSLISKWCKEHDYLSTPYGAWGRCIVASEELAGYLIDHDIDAELIRMTGYTYDGREHWAVWLEDEELVVDTTARQFNPKAKYPLVLGLWEWGDEGCEWLADGLNLDAFTYERGFINSDPLWSEVHVREDIETGEMTYPPEALAERSVEV